MLEWLEAGTKMMVAMDLYNGEFNSMKLLESDYSVVDVFSPPVCVYLCFTSYPHLHLRMKMSLRQITLAATQALHT